MDTDEAALLRSVHASRGDATPRLIYADWLDDNGRPQEAAMHRYIADPSERHRDLFVGQHGGDASRAAFVLSNHAYDRAQSHHDARNLREGTDSYAAQDAWNATRSAHWAAESKDPVIASRHHYAAGTRHNTAATWFTSQMDTGAAFPDATHDAVAELHNLHTAAGLLHRHVASTVLHGRA